ncbi:unnamed protein product [Ceratitis capitata]|uniref:(Mediterranean fruit fly) hypothetical protein n=1 Tax=Ceratitis capitata TaxID=7213 RepID=A0A811V1E3_CERCA|nr:unnamed protein product [Ceratitis capitata]
MEGGKQEYKIQEAKDLQGFKTLTIACARTALTTIVIKIIRSYNNNNNKNNNLTHYHNSNDKNKNNNNAVMRTSKKLLGNGFTSINANLQNYYKLGLPRRIEMLMGGDCRTRKRNGEFLRLRVELTQTISTYNTYVHPAAAGTGAGGAGVVWTHCAVEWSGHKVSFYGAVNYCCSAALLISGF